MATERAPASSITALTSPNPGAKGRSGELRFLSTTNRGDTTPLELFLAGVRGWEVGLLRGDYGNPIFVEKSHRKKPSNLSNEASSTIDG
jgi:hypothetical protein